MSPRPLALIRRKFQDGDIEVKQIVGFLHEGRGESDVFVQGRCLWVPSVGKREFNWYQGFEVRNRSAKVISSLEERA